VEGTGRRTPGAVGGNMAFDDWGTGASGGAIGGAWLKISVAERFLIFF